MIQSLLRRFGYAPITLAANGVRVGYNAGGGEPSGFAVTAGSPENDYSTDWQFPQLVTTARKMMADPQVSKEIRSIRLQLIKAEWMYEPASDDPRDVLVAEFCDAALLGKDTEHFGPEFWIATPWKKRLGEILRFLQFGFSHFCRVERQEGRFNVVADMRYLMPESIDPAGFLCEDKANPDALSALLRTYTDATGKIHSRERVEMDKIAWYTFEEEGGNFLGRPLLRDMHKPWWYKELKERLDMINTQKCKVGIPFTQSRKDATQQDKDNLEKLAKSMGRGNYEHSYAAVTEGDDFGWKEGGASDKGFTESINLSNQEISTAGLSQFMDAGNQDSSTTRGTTGTKAAASSLLIGAVADMVIWQEMKEAQRLILSNFPSVRRFPMLKVSEVDILEKTRSIPEAVSSIQAARNLKDVDLENEIRTRYGFEEVDPDTIEAMQPDPALPAALPPAKDGEEEVKPKDEEAASPATLARQHRLAQGQEADFLSRAKVNPDRIRNELGKYEDVYFAALRSVLGQMRDDVVGRVHSGQLEPRTPKDVKVSASLIQELRNRLKGTILGARDFGRDELVAEIKRQVRGTKIVLDRADPDTRRAAVSFANQQAEVVIEVDVKAIVDRLQAQTVEQYNQLLLSAKTPTEIAKGLDAYLAGISDQQLLEMARGSTGTAFNLGRHIGIQELKKDLNPYAVRAEVLDVNTCEVCEAYVTRADRGEKFLINSREYFANMPPIGCLGKEKCRGFYVVEALPEEIAA
jgi:hypothetical protein